MKLKEQMKSIIQELQMQVADLIGKQVNRYKPRKIRIGLVVFLLLTGMFCFLLIMGVVGTNDSTYALKVDSISVPKDIHKFSTDSPKALHSKVLDSVKSIIKQLYKDQLNTNY